VSFFNTPNNFTKIYTFATSIKHILIMSTDELIVNNEVETIQPTLKKETKCRITGSTLLHIAVYTLFLAALIVLYVLHFTAPKAPVFIP